MMKHVYKLRIASLFMVFVICFGAILGKLFFIQIRSHEFYTNLAQQQYKISIEQLSPRANILDRHGNPLAQNQHVYSAFILPHSLQDIEMTSSFLQNHFPYAYKRLSENPHTQFIYVKRKLQFGDIQLFKKHALADVKFLKESHRYYPLQQAAAPLIGITNIDNQGIMGLELLYEENLSGEPTSYLLEKDARSQKFYFKQHKDKQGNDGESITTTIDSDIQFLTYKAVKNTVKKYNAHSAAAVVMNPDTGEIIALVSYPSFDPHNTEELDISHTKNIPVNNVYELGSVMKIFVALAALQEEVVTPDELINCQDKRTAYVNGVSINTWKAHGTIPFQEVIQRSNNIGIVTVAQRLGPLLYNHYINLGFGTKTNIDLPGEQTGFVSAPSNWSKRSIASLSFGYEISASLLQLARALSVIVNGGYLVTPHINAHKKVQKIKTPYFPEHLESIKEILVKTVSEGTGHRAKITNYTVLGKTGTANLLIDGAYDSDRNRFTFSGAIEKESYKRVIITFVEDTEQTGLYASQVTTPLFREIAECILIHDKII